MKIWFDIANSPHVHFFAPIFKHLSKQHELIISARDFSETLPMLKAIGIDPIVIGDHKGKSRIRKVMGMLTRIFDINKQLPAFDVSISIGGQVSTIVSWMRHKKAVVFTDNDLSYKYHSYKLGSYFIFPQSFNTDKVKKVVGDKGEIIQYHGFKEQVYMADYVPNPEFIKVVPLTDYLLIRPENLKASYVPKDTVSLVPELFKRFKDEKILFIPRYKEERAYAAGYSNIFMPDKPLNGLDACYYSKAVLTGAGTFAREAAMLGVPAVSFFPRESLLTVDRVLVDEGKMLHSRSISDIAAYVASAHRSEAVMQNNKQVQQEVFGILDSILLKVKQ